MIKHIESKSEFEKVLAENPLVLVDFFATWCGPCRMLGPVLEEIQEEKATEALIVKIDVDNPQNKDVARQFGIRSIPTLILFKNGEPVRTSLGFIPKDEVINFINK